MTMKISVSIYLIILICILTCISLIYVSIGAAAIYACLMIVSSVYWKAQYDISKEKYMRRKKDEKN